MTTMASTVGAPSARTITWTSINWKTIQDFVYRLQTRIAKAIKIEYFQERKLKQRKFKDSRATFSGLRGTRAV